MEDIKSDLAALARDLAHLAATIDDRVVSRRLTEMADEVLGLAERESADSLVYHSATIFVHTEGANIAQDPYADHRPPRSMQRN